MFTTFASMAPSSVSASPGDNPQPQLNPVPPPRTRQKKRGQVARACDWCRVHRIKCDSDTPCSNCKNRGGQCSNSGSMKSATLPHAYREIERLRQRVQELELEKEREKEREAEKPVLQLRTPASSSVSSSLQEHQDLGSLDLDFERTRPKSFWDGIHISTARSPRKTWYGSSSLFYFIGRVDAFLTAAFQQTHLADRMLPNSASNLLDGPTTVSGEDSAGLLTSPIDDPVNAGEYLTSTQEEYFLGLFWQSYYTTCPILDEVDFKKHYRSLWETSEENRKPSALVDIVIAVCMQYGMARLPSAERGLSAKSKANVSNTDATIAGRWHYRRCQTFLSAESESPTLATLQCHILCSIYLCCGSFMNMAFSALGLGVQTAYMLGLHLEPPQSMPLRERETRKRVWWTLFVLETKMSMKLGRPFLLHDASTTCTLPADDREIAMLVGSCFAPLGENVTWLTWNLHNTKLILAARAAYTSFYDRDPGIFNAYDSQPITDRLDRWLKDVPAALKTQRQKNGVAFSTDQSPLQIEKFAPVWLQRQRLLLELMYHNLCSNLYRPSISFAPASAQTPAADKTAIKCAAHAMALTHIMHQVLTSTGILAGWLESFQWQWNAAVTLVGFVLAHPHGPSTGAARSTIDLAVAVLQTFGNSFAVAAGAANIISELRVKIDVLINRKTEGKDAMMQDTMPLVAGYHEADETNFMNGDFTALPAIDNSLNFFDIDNPELTGVLAQSIDNFATDMYSDFDLHSMGSGVDLSGMNSGVDLLGMDSGVDLSGMDGGVDLSSITTGFPDQLAFG